MRLRLWGTRGSTPAPGPETARYGGNTSCVEVLGDDPGQWLILDAGSGIRRLGISLQRERPRRIDIMLTHLHLDHVMGLGFFGPLWTRGTEIHIWGPASATRSLGERLARYLSPPLFPVRMSEIPSNLHLHDAPEDTIPVGGFTVTCSRILHSGPTVGYRVTDGRVSVGYMPDHEPALGQATLAVERPEWLSGYQVARDVDLLLHDAQYSDVQYSDRAGWGHSSISQVVSYAVACRVSRLAMFHHDPRHSDAELEALRAKGRRLWQRYRPASDLVLAAEETEFHLDPEADEVRLVDTQGVAGARWESGVAG
jgi:phosphoribosyl 1,2-cyclic phosphodiesterase